MILLLTITMNSDKVFIVKRLTITKKFLKNF
nr:MAG TPA: Ragulator complex protein LAMTOR3, Ragulator signal transduction, SIGNALING PROTEIN.01A [Caudoviricetes sp.]